MVGSIFLFNLITVCVYDCLYVIKQRISREVRMSTNYVLCFDNNQIEGVDMAHTIYLTPTPILGDLGHCLLEGDDFGF